MTLGPGRVHVVGVAGTGMSALAQFRALRGLATSGSDRAFDQQPDHPDRQHLQRLGIQLFPQDGTGVVGCAAVLTSTAVEAAIPDLARAHAMGVPVIHRADALAEILRNLGTSVGIAGTSGKSTVTGMVFTILESAGRRPSLISGGDLLSLREKGLRGNAWWDIGPLVAELDESDGTLVRHAPTLGVVLNLHHDHMDSARVMEQFQTFVRQCGGPALCGDDAELEPLRSMQAVAFGFTPSAQIRGDELWLGPDASRFRVEGTTYDVPIPGHHNAQNALAAVAAALTLGIPAADIQQGLRQFAGIARRFEKVGTVDGIRVVDDFAHNPTKIRATLRAGQGQATRVLALYQPHGFGPTRFMRQELSTILPPVLRPEDRLDFAPIFFAGGTAQKDISAHDLAKDLAAAGAPSCAYDAREDWVEDVVRDAAPGDLILVMGARDGTLNALARQVVAGLQQRRLGKSVENGPD